MLRDASIDLGNSKIVFSAEGNSEVFNLERVTPNGASVSIMPHTYLNGLMKQLEFAARDVSNLVVVGGAHNVTGQYINGRRNLGYVGEPPYLDESILPAQIRLGLGGVGVSKDSALLKLHELGTNSGLVKAVWGETATHKDVRYTGLMSLVAGVVMKEWELPTFPDDWKDLAPLISTVGLDQTLEWLGIGKGNLIISDQDTIKLGGGREVTVMQDMKVDSWLISRLFEQGVLEPGTIVILTDSVMKFGTDREVAGWKQSDRFHYNKMFMGGHTGRQWVQKILNQLNVAQDLGATFTKYKEILHESEMPVKWFFDPWANKEDGGLWTKLGGRWLQIPKEEMKQWVSKENYEEVVKAIGWGVAAGVYSEIPVDFKEVALMSGLIGLFGKEAQIGWKHVLVEAAPRGVKVRHLPIPDSSASASFWIRANRGEMIDYGKEIELIDLGVGGGLWEKWQNLKEDVGT